MLIAIPWTLLASKGETRILFNNLDLQYWVKDFSQAEPEKPVLTRSFESEILTCGGNTAPDISRKFLFIFQ